MTIGMNSQGRDPEIKTTPNHEVPASDNCGKAFDLSQPEETQPSKFSLIAYHLNRPMPMSLVPAVAHRFWMDTTNEGYANRCLPMLIANQAGWFVLNSHALRATWNGGDGLTSLEIDYMGGTPPYPAISHFGYGILTWTLPYLFRTTPGFNLLVRGPTNWPKDGIYPLDGIVESDWTAATFTMNWKLTRAGLPVDFEVGEPICMIVPQRRGDLERFFPEVQDIGCDKEVKQNYGEWSATRQQFLNDLAMLQPEAVKKKWQKHYFQGIAPGGLNASEHQTRLNLRSFEEICCEK